MMERKSTGLIPGGVPHPKIEAGDTWKDGRGSVVTIESYQFNRVTFIREGYPHPCIMPAQRFLKEFHQVETKTFPEWSRENKPLEKLEKIKESLISGRHSK